MSNNRPVLYEILDSLPAYGPMHISIAAGYHSYFSQGFVLRLYKSDGSDWVANFQPGPADLYRVLTFDAMNQLVIVAGGICYFMDPDHTTPLEVFGYNFHSLFSISADRYVLADDTCLTVIEPDGAHWDSERISLDGMAEIRVDGNVVSGLSFSPTSDADEWVPFSYNIDTRTLTGGGFI